MQFAISEVAKLPRLVPLSLTVPAGGHTSIQRLRLKRKKWRTHGLTKRRIHLWGKKQRSSRRVCEKPNRKGQILLVWLQSSSRPPHCNGRAVDEAWLSSPSAHTLRLPAPPRWQWQVCSERTIWVWPQGGAGMQGGCSQRPQQQRQQQLSNSIQRHSTATANSRRRGWNDIRPVYQRRVPSSVPTTMERWKRLPLTGQLFQIDLFIRTSVQKKSSKLKKKT